MSDEHSRPEDETSDDGPAGQRAESPREPGSGEPVQPADAGPPAEPTEPDGEAGAGAEVAEEPAPEAAPERDLEAELAAAKDQLLRALADAENTRRRAERERQDAAKYGIATFARELLAIADNLRRALDTAQELEGGDADGSVQGLVGGVEMTEKLLLAAFDKHGIRKLEPLDEPFDPNLHQAMYEVPGTGKPAGTVVELMQPGYVIHDRLLRPAMVGVAKAEEPGDTHQPVDTTA